MKVLIVQSLMKQYRVAFFQQLHRALLRDGVHLQVAYSKPRFCESLKGGNASLPPEIGEEVDGRWLFGNRVLYQPIIRNIAAADLIIIEQANKYLLNPLILGLSRSKQKKVAFWGHGRNRQGDSTTLSERVKRRTVTWVDWWFAYTGAVRDYVVQLGFPARRVTVVNNSVDTSAFEQRLAEVTTNDLSGARKSLDLPEHAIVGLFCGSLYPDKYLDFLLGAAIRIRKTLPNFHLLIIGGGTDSCKVQAAAQRHNCIHYLGPRFGHEKATYFRLASVFLMPDSVGLAILDALCAGLPLITTNVPTHGPEVGYLQDGMNGVIVERDAGSYANSVAQLLNNRALLAELQEGAARSSRKYSMQHMVENFRMGIIDCMQSQQDMAVVK
jgi:glycosyltransferase involved in cell wall biosynthesis